MPNFTRLSLLYVHKKSTKKEYQYPNIGLDIAWFCVKKKISDVAQLYSPLKCAPFPSTSSKPKTVAASQTALLYYIVSCWNSGPRYVTIVTVGSLLILPYYARGLGRRQWDLGERSTTDSATSSCVTWNLDTEGVLDGRLAGVTHNWGELDQGKSYTAVFHVLSNLLMTCA